VALAGVRGFGGLGMRLNSHDTLYDVCRCTTLTRDGGAVVGANRVRRWRLESSFSESKFWDEVLPATRHGVRLDIGEICRYLLNQPPKATDRQHKEAGDLRKRAASMRSGGSPSGRHPAGCEFYAPARANTAFVNIFNGRGPPASARTPVAFVEYDDETSANGARRKRTGADKVGNWRAGAAFVEGQQLQPFGRYTTRARLKRRWCATLFVGRICSTTAT